MRTSMGPSVGGLTCSLALVRLLSTINDTRSATPCPNSGESTPGATFKVAVEGASVEAEGPELSHCAAPAVPSFDVPDKDKSAALPCVCRSVAPALAVAEIACATDAAVAAVTAELVARSADADAANAAKPCGPPTPGAAAPVSGAASAGALVPWVMAAAMADGVRTRLGASYGLATTGVAGPDPQDGQPVGTVHIAVSAADDTVVRTIALSGNRAEIRRLTVEHALGLLLGRLGEESY